MVSRSQTQEPRQPLPLLTGRDTAARWRPTRRCDQCRHQRSVLPKPFIRITCKHVPATCLLTCSSTRVTASSNGQNTRASSFFNISEYANGGCRGGLCRFEGYLTACLVESSLMLPSDPPWHLSVRRRHPSKEGVLGRSTREDSRGITFSQA